MLTENVDPASTLHTDEAQHYKRPGRDFAKHKSVNHSAGDEYARKGVTTNTVEGFFSIFKRGMRGVYEHCGEQHIHRYLAEFDFRYSNRSRLASRIKSASAASSRALRESASPIGGLVASEAAKRSKRKLSHRDSAGIVDALLRMLFGEAP